MTLAEQLLALCDEHDLNHVSVCVYTLDDGTRFFGAAAHGGGCCGGDSGIGHSPSESLALAISELNGKRAVLVDVPELSAAA